jgi:ADP-ribose pyrophosphatase
MTAPADDDPAPLDGFPTEASQRIYDSRWCGLRRDILRLPDGSLQDYHVFEVTDAVVIVPLLPDGRVVMIWQYRHPHGRTHWEVPAGRIHKNESPVEAAHRELREETGHITPRLEPLPGFFPINGISDHYAHAFVAHDCERVAHPDLDPTEQLEVHVFDPAQVRERLLTGRIADGFTALALWSHFGRAAI